MINDYAFLTKSAEESDMQAPVDTETPAKLRKQNKEIAETMSSSHAGPANSPEALAHGTVPPMIEQTAVDQFAGSNPNGSTAFIGKDASANPLVNLLLSSARSYFPEAIMRTMSTPVYTKQAQASTILTQLQSKFQAIQKAAAFNPGGLASKAPEKAKQIMKEEPKQVASGEQVEQEHTKSPEKAKAIAADHLMEDRKYYTHLNAMEKAVEDKKPVVPAVKSAALTDAELETQLSDKQASITCETVDGKTLNVIGDAFELYKEARKDYNNLTALLALLEESDVNNG